MLMWIDTALLARAQSFADRFQRLTGLTKFWLEKWTIIAAGVFYMIFAARPFVMVLIGIAAILWVKIFFEVKNIENKEKIFLSSGQLYFNEWGDPRARTFPLVVIGLLLVVALVLIPFVSESLWLCLYTIASIARSYFSACIPRPPGKSKMRQWYENGLTWLNDRLKPADAPAMVPSR